eukprot:6095353-Prymnesium_polylepis.2
MVLDLEMRKQALIRWRQGRRAIGACHVAPRAGGEDSRGATWRVASDDAQPRCDAPACKQRE